MLNKALVGGLISLMLTGAASPASAAAVQMPQEISQMHGAPQPEFQHLQQPFWLKAAVTTAGIGLIGLKLWWFLLSKPKAR